MSFGPTNSGKAANNTLGGVSQGAFGTNNQVTPQAGNLLNLSQQTMGQGGQNVDAGANYLNTLFQGNQANTSAALQPGIDQIRGANTNTLNSINTLTPRGGGRSGALFGQSFAPTAQIGNLFNQARTSAATALPQLGLAQQGIGLQQGGLGNNLFGTGNQSLGIAGNAGAQQGQLALQQQKMSNDLVSGLVGSLFGLATTPFGGTLLGKIPGLG